jgi:acetyl-CoA carboxylase biotin carboxylase subunit
MPISRLLIANRGEIAVRIQREARELGIKAIQVYSAADADSLAVRMVDEAINIGPFQAAKSYLNIEAILAAARATGADAIHPGYGFVSENPVFADAIEAAGLIFVGPKGETIGTVGDKAAARSAAQCAGMPVVPGFEGRITDIDEALKLAKKIGWSNGS